MADHPHLRIARPTDDLDRLAAMYAAGLDLQILARFDDHDGFDGVMLGAPGGAYHLEFTRRRNVPAQNAATEEHLLVLYYPDHDAWRARCDRMRRAGFRAVPSANPYWDARGITFEDADGYRVVIQNAPWPAPPA